MKLRQRKKNYYHPYEGRRKPLWLKILLALVLLAEVAFAVLEGFVLSGGQGDDEHVSEAQAMYDYLVEHGADGDQIIREDRSRNTWQNVNNTLDLFQSGEIDGTERVLLVSSDFHLTRIQMLWNRASGGGDTLSTLAAPVSHFPSRVQMFFREPFALVKSFLFDR